METVALWNPESDKAKIKPYYRRNLDKVALKSLISHQYQTGSNADDLNERERMIYGWVGYEQGLG